MAGIAPGRYCTEHREELYEVGNPLESRLRCPNGDHEVGEFFLTPDGIVSWEVNEFESQIRGRTWPSVYTGRKKHGKRRFAALHHEMKFTLPDKAYSLVIRDDSGGEE